MCVRKKVRIQNQSLRTSRGMITSRNWSWNVLDCGDREAAVSANPSTRIIRFSTFEVDLQTGELRQRGQKLRLQEQPFQVLAALLERPGEIVTREELRSPAESLPTFPIGSAMQSSRSKQE